MCRSSEAVYFRAITNSVLFKLQFVFSLFFLFRNWHKWYFNFRKHHLLLLSISLTSSLPTCPEAPNTRQFGAGEGSDAIFEFTDAPWIPEWEKKNILIALNPFSYLGEIGSEKEVGGEEVKILFLRGGGGNRSKSKHSLLLSRYSRLR